MRKMKRVLSLVLCLIMLAGVLIVGSSCSTKKAGVLRVGMECAYAPFNWTQSDDSNGAVKIVDSESYANGYDVQMAKKIAADMGYTIEVVKTEWDGLIPALQSGKIDLIIAGMSVNPDRSKVVDFSSAYYNANIVVVTMKDSPYASATSLAELAGAKMTSQRGTNWYDLLAQITGADILPAMDDVPSLLVALTSGKIDAYTTDAPTAMAASYANPDLVTLVFAEGKGLVVSQEETQVNVAVKKGSADLLKGVNAALAKISESDRETIMKNAVAQQPLAN